MSDEEPTTVEEGDDDALYDTWEHFTPEQVDALHDLVAFLAIYRRKRGHDPEARRAIALVLVAVGLGHLPDVSESL